jgi:hypothetical protein
LGAETGMTDKPSENDEPGAEERFERGIKNALATKPTPHKPPAKAPAVPGRKRGRPPKAS